MVENSKLKSVLTRTDQYYQEYYNSRRPIKFFDFMPRFFHKKMFRIAERVIPNIRKGKLLEVGVGFGHFAKEARAQNCNYVGIEMNTSLAEDLCSQGFDVTVASIPPFPVGEFVNTIWMSHILEHAATYLEARNMLEAALNRLEVGGHLVLITPDYLSWGSYFWDVDWSHGFPTTLRRVKQIVSDVGFEVVYAKHHTATITNPVLRSVTDAGMRFIPHRFLDWIFQATLRRTFAYNFMALLGWRQLFVVGRKTK